MTEAPSRVSILDIRRMKRRGERIPMVTAYDYTSAQMVDRAGIPLLLVGDSLGMVVLGHETPIPVTIDDMIHHARAVMRGSRQALVIGDLPFQTYSSEESAQTNAAKLVQEGGVQAVKLEGGRAFAPAVRRLVESGIPVMGHLGLTPQSINQMGGWRVQGRRRGRALQLLEDALALQEAGAFALVLELVPAQLAAEITKRLKIPTIGIGAGPGCDGQVLVWHDLLGLYTDRVPRHNRQYAKLADTITAALKTYADEVQDGAFPTAEHSPQMDDAELHEALQQLDAQSPDSPDPL